ncbi:MAG: hypothetical protein JETCAE03_34660 [Ignavibacteriaceae bacterium]|jgi:hypothetical protein|nr:MAG: hypothetical protein JETCAE03_34660 [Ignavibacteriaceae bacterium]
MPAIEYDLEIQKFFEEVMEDEALDEVVEAMYDYYFPDTEELTYDDPIAMCDIPVEIY